MPLMFSLLPESSAGHFFICPLSLDWLKLSFPIFYVGYSNLNVKVILGKVTNFSRGKKMKFCGQKFEKVLSFQRDIKLYTVNFR